MIFIRLLRMVLCLILTVVIWPMILLIAIIMLFIMEDSDGVVTPKKVYNTIKESITSWTIQGISFMKNEIR